MRTYSAGERFRRPVHDKRGSVFATHERERGSARMRAALGAAGDVQRERSVEEIAIRRCESGGDVARGDAAGGAGRRTGAGRNRDARIGGVDDEAERGGGLLQLPAGFGIGAEEKQGAARGEPDFGAAEGYGFPCGGDDLFRRHRAEGKRDAESMGGAQGKNREGRGSPRLHDRPAGRVFYQCQSCIDPRGVEVPCASLPAEAGDGGKDCRRRIRGSGFGERTERSCGRRVATNRKMPCDLAGLPFGDEPYVGEDAGEVDTAAAVYHDGNFRAKPAGQAGIRDSGADRFGERARVGYLVGVDSRQRPRLDRHAAAHGNAHCVHVGRQ